MPQLPLMYVMVCCNCIAAGMACGQCTVVGRAGSAWPVVTVYSSGYILL